MERDGKTISKPTVADTLEGPVVFKAKQVSVRKKETPADRLAQSIFDDWLGLAATRRATAVLERVGADRLARLIRERAASEGKTWPPPEAFVRALNDAQDRLEECTETLYRERLSPVIFSLGCTDRLPDHLKAPPPRTARQPAEKFERINFQRRGGR